LKPQKSRQVSDFVEKQMKEHFFVPVIAHNMRGYDSHLIIKHMEKKFTCADISVIASNTEKFISFQIGQLRFLDSLQFLNASLDALVANLARDGSKFEHTSRHFSDRASFSRVTRKGIYSYEFMDGPDIFNHTSLPPIKSFYSKLYNASITEDDYERAKDVWNHFNIQNMKQYHDHYLLTDTLLLADVFENFRRVAMSNYELDPCHYYTSPGLSLSACLKFTGIELQLFTSIDQLLFIEKGIRGGISTIVNRYSKANHPNAPYYDPNSPHKFIVYLDANNLYGYAMSEPLPIGGFWWVNRGEIKQLNILSIGEDDEIGYIFEVDLECPCKLHEAHNDYPLAPEAFPISSEILSPRAKELLGKWGKNRVARLKS